MAEYIIESEMKFGPFQKENLICLESIPQYLEKQKGMHIAEFIYYDKKRIILVEAKKSAPNPNSEKIENPKEHFEEYIDTIKEKLVNSLDLYVNMVLKDEVPSGFSKVDYNIIDIVFVVVIKNQQKEWLKDVQDALEMKVRRVIRASKIWKCKVLVINEEIAKRIKLIET